MTGSLLKSVKVYSFEEDSIKKCFVLMLNMLFLTFVCRQNQRHLKFQLQNLISFENELFWLHLYHLYLTYAIKSILFTV